MYKFIMILGISAACAFFSVLNPHPVAVSIFPGSVIIVPLKTALSAVLLAGICFGLILQLPAVFSHRRRVRGLKEDVYFLENKLKALAEHEEKLPADAELPGNAEVPADMDTVPDKCAEAMTG